MNKSTSQLDQQLLELVRRTPPEELTPGDLKLLQDRLSDSPELLQAMAGQLRMEEYLTAALGAVDLRTEDILNRSSRHRDWRSTLASPAVATTALLLLGGVVGLVIFAVSRPAAWEVAQPTPQTEGVPREVPVAERLVDLPDDPTDSAMPLQEDTSTPPDESASEYSEPAEETSLAAPADQETAIEPQPDPPPEPAVIPVVPPGPWQQALAAEPQPYQQVWFRALRPEDQLISLEEVGAWLTDANPSDSEEQSPTMSWELADSPRGKAPRMQGITRLQSPWPADTILRLDMHAELGFRIHFFHGDQGATIVYYAAGPLHWAGYRTERSAGQSTPHRYELTASDGYRVLRTGGPNAGPIDLRYNDREIILSRGEIELLRVPLPGAPEEVYLEGMATIYGIDLYRAADPPPAPPRPEVLAQTPPAELPWEVSLQDERMSLERLEDGSIHFTAEQDTPSCTITTPLELLMPSEVVLELSNVSRGMQVYLAEGDQEYRATIHFPRDPGSDRLHAVLHYDRHVAPDSNAVDLSRHISPRVGDHVWVKLLRVSDTLRCWLSVDGEHWAEWALPLDDADRKIDRLGIAYNGGGSNLTVHRVELRPLPGLEELVDEEVLRRATGPAGPAELEPWLAAVDAERPQDIPETPWRRARALRLIAQGSSPQHTEMLLDYLHQSVVKEDSSPQDQLALLHAASLLHPGITNDSEATSVKQRYEEIGQRAHAQGEERPFTLIQQASCQAPWIYTTTHPWGCERLQNWELAYPIFRGQWQEVSDTCQRWQFVNIDRGTPLTAWAAAKAEDGLAGDSAGTDLYLRQDWLPPVSPIINQHLDDQVFALEAAIASEDLAEACNTIGKFDTSVRACELARTSVDNELFVRPRAAISLNMSVHPELQEVMQTQFGDLAALRVRTAVYHGDFKALERAAMQFHSTTAAQEAKLHLGNRALSAGNFVEALNYFLDAEHAAPETLADQLRPRIRLTAAMLGRDVGEPVVDQVNLGQVSYSAQDFEMLISEMLARSASQSSTLPNTPAWQPAGPAPAPTGYSVQQRAVFDGPAGANVPEHSFPLGKELQLPWVERQLATTLHEDVLYVNNRFQVAAYDVTSGARLWQNALPFGDHAFDQRPFTPMKPLVTPNRLICRMLDGPRLAGLDPDNGELVWSAFDGGRWKVTDPVMWNGKVCELIMRPNPAQAGGRILQLEPYDPQTGQVLRGGDLVDIWPSTYLSHAAQLTLCGNRLVISCEGATLCLDQDYRVLWLRRHTTMPDQHARYWAEQDQHPALYDGEGRIYTAFPGRPTIECIALENGGSCWQAVLADLRGIVGLTEGVLLARTQAGFVGYDAETGEQLWRTEVENLCEGVLSGGEGGLLCVRRVGRSGDSLQHPQLVWLDPHTGEVRQTFTLDTLAGPEPQIGPIVNLGEKLWLFYAPDPATIERQIYELTANASMQQTP